MTAPTAAYTVGTQVGVPTGTVLTPTVGLPVTDVTEDATESLLITHPVTAETATLTVKVWRHRSWSEQLTLAPPAGEHWLFDECQFTATGAFWVVAVDPAAVPDVMSPRAVFRSCTIDGTDTTSRAVEAASSWFLNCHVTGGADAFDDGSFCVIQGCNLIASTSGAPDEHSDGFQSTGIGRTTLYECWASAGTGPGASEAIRFATEFGSAHTVYIHYCGIDRGGWSLQINGTTGAGNTMSALSIVGCRWTRLAGFGPYDIYNIIGLTWSDNAYADNGQVITIPTPDPVGWGAGIFAAI